MDSPMVWLADDGTKRSAPAKAVTPALVKAAQGYMAAGVAESTRRAYRTDWATFTSWCREHDLEPCPAAPDTIVLYASSRAASGKKVATIERALAAISQAHRAANVESPCSAAVVLATMRGIRRTHGVRQNVKAALSIAELRRLLRATPSDMAGLRDRALILCGFAGGLRRSEIVGLDVSDVTFTADGAVLTLGRSKTDQEGVGREIGIPYGSDPATCPVRALKMWILNAGLATGSLFRPLTRGGQLSTRARSRQRLDPKDVARIIKRRASAAGLDARPLASHSLRSGLATAASAAGKSERTIMEQTGHRSLTTVRKYIRRGRLFADNAASGIGL